MVVGGKRHLLPALPSGKIRYPFYRRLDGPHSRSVRLRKISSPNGIRSSERPARSESLYPLSYTGTSPLVPLTSQINSLQVTFMADFNIIFPSAASFPSGRFSSGSTTKFLYFTALYRTLASSHTRLLDHTQRRATVGRTPLNE